MRACFRVHLAPHEPLDLILSLLPTHKYPDRHQVCPVGRRKLVRLQSGQRVGGGTTQISRFLDSVKVGSLGFVRWEARSAEK